MPSLPEPLLDLVSALGKLPGIGPRSAERIALHLVQSDPVLARRVAEAISRARERIRNCSLCGGLSESEQCAICSATNRDQSLLCVVERPVDVFTIEKAGSFRGRYHVLGGRISPTNAIGPEDLRIAELEHRVQSEQVKEVILALGSDVEGDATSFYLAKRLGAGVRVTRIAQGLPAGSGLDFADEVTLNRALEGRRSIE